MSFQLDKITGPLIVAGVIALVGFAWRISLQVEGIQHQVDNVKLEVRTNRWVTCRLAQKDNILIETCPQ